MEASSGPSRYPARGRAPHRVTPGRGTAPPPSDGSTAPPPTTPQKTPTRSRSHPYERSPHSENARRSRSQPGVGTEGSGVDRHFERIPQPNFGFGPQGPPPPIASGTGIFGELQRPTQEPALFHLQSTAPRPAGMLNGPPHAFSFGSYQPTSHPHGQMMPLGYLPGQQQYMQSGYVMPYHQQQYHHSSPAAFHHHPGLGRIQAPPPYPPPFSMPMASGGPSPGYGSPMQVDPPFAIPGPSNTSHLPHQASPLAAGPSPALNSDPYAALPESLHPAPSVGNTQAHRGGGSPVGSEPQALYGTPGTTPHPFPGTAGIRGMSELGMMPESSNSQRAPRSRVAAVAGRGKPKLPDHPLVEPYTSPSQLLVSSHLQAAAAARRHLDDDRAPQGEGSTTGGSSSGQKLMSSSGQELMQQGKLVVPEILINGKPAPIVPTPKPFPAAPEPAPQDLSAAQTCTGAVHPAAAQSIIDRIKTRLEFPALRILMGIPDTREMEDHSDDDAVTTNDRPASPSTNDVPPVSIEAGLSDLTVHPGANPPANKPPKVIKKGGKRRKPVAADAGVDRSMQVTPEQKAAALQVDLRLVTAAGPLPGPLVDPSTTASWHSCVLRGITVPGYAEFAGSDQPFLAQPKSPGEGTYGKVYKVSVDGRLYALKVVDEETLLEEILHFKLLIHAFLTAGNPYAGAIRFLMFGQILGSDLAIDAPIFHGTRRKSVDVIRAVIRVCQLYRKSFGALSHLQAVSVHHRDIKSANLLVDDNDNVELGDMGTMMVVNGLGHDDHFGTTYIFCNVECTILGLWNRARVDPSTKDWPQEGWTELDGLVKQIVPHGMTFSLDVFSMGMSCMLDMWHVSGREQQGVNYTFHDVVNRLWTMPLGDWANVKQNLYAALQEFASLYVERSYEDELGLFPCLKRTFETIRILTAPTGLHAIMTGKVDIPPTQRLHLAYKAMGTCIEDLERDLELAEAGEWKELYAKRAANLLGLGQASTKTLKPAVHRSPKTPKSPAKVAFAQALGQGDGHGDFYWEVQSKNVDGTTKYKVIMKGHQDKANNLIQYYLPRGFILATKFPVGYEKLFACAWPGCTKHAPVASLAKAVLRYKQHLEEEFIETPEPVVGKNDTEVPDDCGRPDCAHHVG